MKITKQQLKRVIKEELQSVLLKETEDCFDRKTFKAKSSCIQSQKGWDEERANAYVASVERKRGHIKEGFFKNNPKADAERLFNALEGITTGQDEEFVREMIRSSTYSNIRSMINLYEAFWDVLIEKGETEDGDLVDWLNADFESGLGMYVNGVLRQVGHIRRRAIKEETQALTQEQVGLHRGQEELINLRIGSARMIASVSAALEANPNFESKQDVKVAIVKFLERLRRKGIRYRAAQSYIDEINNSLFNNHIVVRLEN